MLNVNQSQYQYDDLAKSLGCSTSSDSLSCLRSKTAQEFQLINDNVAYPGAKTPPLYMWNPVLDDDLVRDYVRMSYETGKFIKVPVLLGDDTNAGTIFTPKGTSSLNQSSTFLRSQFPYLTADQLSRIS